MKFTTGASINMSGLRGYVGTTFKELCEVFGPPDYGPQADMDKTTCEWRLKFEDGTVASIYDYKTNRTPMMGYEWHIGGYDDRAVELVQECINMHRDPLVRAVRDFQPNERVTG